MAFSFRFGNTGLNAGRAGSASRIELFWKLELIPASLILRTSSSYKPLSVSASCLRDWYSKERAFSRSNSALVSATALFSMASRLTASWYSTATRCAMLFFKASNCRRQLGKLGVAPSCTRDGWRRTAPHDGELLARFVQAVRQLPQLLALGGGLRRFQRTALHGVERRLLADPVGLGVGEFGVELQQARGKDAGLLLRVDDAQVPFELRQGRRRSLHLGPQLFHLLFHEGGEAGGGAEADVVGVLDVALGDCVGHVRRQFRVGRAVADQQQVGVGRARHLQPFQGDRRILRPVTVGNSPVERRDFGDRNLEALHHRAQHRIGLDDFDLRGQKLVRVVGGHTGGVLAHDAGRRLAVHVDGGRGFVDRREPRGDQKRRLQPKTARKTGSSTCGVAGSTDSARAGRSAPRLSCS